MSGEKEKIVAVLRRELIETRSLRRMALLAAPGLLQFVAAAASANHGRVEDTYVVYMLGGMIGIVLVFDLMAKEREHHTLDILLTQGISRRGLFVAKWIGAVSICFAAATLLVAGTLLGSAISGNVLSWRDYLAEWGMIGWFLTVYGLLALLFSCALRRSKWALAGAAFAWLLVRPPFVALLVFEPLEAIVGWSRQRSWQIMAALPDFAMRIGLEPARAVPDSIHVNTSVSYVALALYALGFSLLGWWVFSRQDEPTV